MATVHISDRKVNKSVRKAINEIHSDPIWGYVEAVINAFSAMKSMVPRERTVTIILKAGRNGQDAYIVAPGTGITNYDYIEKNIGYDTDSEEYILKQRNPDYLNKMGIGIPSIASLSRDGIADFRSVSLNSKGQEEGLVATYTLQGEGGFIIPAEHPDSKYVFSGVDGTSADMKTGVWIVIKNVKHYPLWRVSSLLSEVFARKLTSGYNILIREKIADESQYIRAPIGFCSKHEEVIGYVHDRKFGDFPVYADIHLAERPDDARVRVLMKKMTIDKFESEYMARGYAGCDILDYKPDREGISIDHYNDNFIQYKNLVISYYIKRGIDKKPIEQMKNLKNEKKWTEKMQEVFIKYYKNNPWHKLLSVDAIPSVSQLTGKGTKVTSPRKRCADGYHWDKKLQVCVPNTEDTKHIGLPTGTGTPKKPPVKKVPKKMKLGDEFTEQSIPAFKTRKGNDPNRFCIYVNEQESAIIFNTAYPWINDVWDNPTDDLMNLLLNIALMTSVQDNQGISAHEFLMRLAQQL